MEVIEQPIRDAQALRIAWMPEHIDFKKRWHHTLILQVFSCHVTTAASCNHERRRIR